jgi:hypothetical protein
MEEFEMAVRVGSCLLYHDFMHKQTLFHLQAYWVEAIEPVRYQLREHQEARWATFDELLELPLVPSDTVILIFTFLGPIGQMDCVRVSSEIWISSLPCPCPPSDPLQAQPQVYAVTEH